MKRRQKAAIRDAKKQTIPFWKSRWSKAKQVDTDCDNNRDIEISEYQDNDENSDAHMLASADSDNNSGIEVHMDPQDDGCDNHNVCGVHVEPQDSHSDSVNEISDSLPDLAEIFSDSSDFTPTDEESTSDPDAPVADLADTFCDSSDFTDDAPTTNKLTSIF
jgi:hypothetical protein